MLPPCSGIGTRTCVVLFLFLLVRCYVSTVVYVTLVHLVLYSSVPVALLDLALDAAVVLHGHGELASPPHSTSSAPQLSRLRFHRMSPLLPCLSVHLHLYSDRHGCLLALVQSSARPASCCTVEDARTSF